MVYLVSWLGGSARIEANSPAEAVGFLKDKIYYLECVDVVIRPAGELADAG